MDAIEFVIEKWDRRHEAEAKRHPSRIPLRRESDRTVYSWQCAHCGGCWKVYQSPSHHPDCGPHLIDLRKLRKGRRVVHADHGVGTVVSVRRDREPSGLQDGHVTVLFDRGDRRRRERRLSMRGEAWCPEVGVWRETPPAMLARRAKRC